MTDTNNISGSVDVALLYSWFKWVNVMDGVKFEINDINHYIRKTILSEDRLSACIILLSRYIL